MADQFDNNAGPLSTSLTMRTREGDEAEIQNLPAPVMQALYHQITGKRETISEDFDGDFIIKIGDISNLVSKVAQTLQQFNFVAMDETYTIFHSKRETVSHTSKEKFLQYDANRGDPVSAIEVRLNFLLSVPMVGAHQNYTITITLNSFNLRKRDYWPQMGIGARGRDHDSIACINFSIDYIDYVVARSFSSTIREWVEALPKTKILRMPRIVERHRYQISETIKLLFSVSLSALILFLIGGFEINLTVFWVLFLVGLLALSYSLSSMIVEIADDMLGVYRFFPYLIVNRGDERNYGEFIARRRKLTR